MACRVSLLRKQTYAVRERGLHSWGNHVFGDEERRSFFMRQEKSHAHDGLHHSRKLLHLQQLYLPHNIIISCGTSTVLYLLRAKAAAVALRFVRLQAATDYGDDGSICAFVVRKVLLPTPLNWHITSASLDCRWCVGGLPCFSPPKSRQSSNRRRPEVRVLPVASVLCRESQRYVSSPVTHHNGMVRWRSYSKC